MATTINQNGINFAVETGGKTHAGWGKKYTNANNILDGVYDPDPQNIEKSINAVEIDWNGAQIEDNVIINSTGDLLSWIKTKGGNGGGTIL